MDYVSVGNVMCVCLYQKSVKFTVPVCKVARLTFSCQTSAISFPFIPIPWKYGCDGR